MKKSETKYYLIIAVLVAIYIFFEATKPTPPDYNPSFSNDDKVPFGSYLVYERLGDLFSGEIDEIKMPVYNLFVDSVMPPPTAYIIINDQFQPDKYDIEYLLDFVYYQENHVFLSAELFSRELADTLGFQLTRAFSEKFSRDSLDRDSVKGRFLNPNVESEAGYDFMNMNNNVYFTKFDTLNTVVLATNNQGKPILLKYSFGEGTLYLNSTPYMMTNYHLLFKENHGFIEKAFSHLPAESHIIWDEYYKSRHQQYLEQVEGSKLGFIMSQPPLKWAWYLVIFAGIFYVLFEAKRKQRIIPIVKPLPNMTLDFTETIGRLYYQSDDHKNIAEKKIKIWLEYIRSHFFLKTHEIDESFIKALAAKSEVPEMDIRALIHVIGVVHKQDQIMEQTLTKLNFAIESFYTKTKV